MGEALRRGPAESGGIAAGERRELGERSAGERREMDRRWRSGIRASSVNVRLVGESSVRPPRIFGPPAENPLEILAAPTAESWQNLD